MVIKLPEWGAELVPVEKRIRRKVSVAITVLRCMRLAETFLAAAYYGSRLAEDRGSGISVREKQLIEKLATYMDQIIEMGR